MKHVYSLYLAQRLSDSSVALWDTAALSSLLYEANPWVLTNFTYSYIMPQRQSSMILFSVTERKMASYLFSSSAVNVMKLLTDHRNVVDSFCPPTGACYCGPLVWKAGKLQQSGAVKWEGWVSSTEHRNPWGDNVRWEHILGEPPCDRAETFKRHRASFGI